MKTQLWIVWTTHYGDAQWLASFTTSDQQAAIAFRVTAKISGLRAKVLPDYETP